MKTVLYGGAFDPPHLGHEAVIRALLTEADVEKVVCVPSGYRSEKVYKSTETHRRAILEIFAARFQRDHRFVMDYDCVDGKVARTTTIGMQEYYQDKFGIEPYQVFGTQEVASMDSWYQAERVKKEVSKILIVRNGIIPDLSGLQKTEILPIELPKEVQTLSSTQVRESVRNTIFSWLCPEIADYIQKHHLYE